MDDEDLASFTKEAYAGCLKFEGSANVTVDLHDCGLRVTGAFGELVLPYESMARWKVWKDSSGSIRIAIDDLTVLLDIGAMSDRVAFFARLEEWTAGPGPAA